MSCGDDLSVVLWDWIRRKPLLKVIEQCWVMVYEAQRENTTEGKIQVLWTARAVVAWWCAVQGCVVGVNWYGINTYVV